MERDGIHRHYGIGAYPPALEEKVQLFINFRSCISDYYIKAEEAVPSRVADEMTPLTFLREWCWGKGSRTLIMHLSNGTLQVKFFLNL